MKSKYKIILFSVFVGLISLQSCDEFGKYELPESGSIADVTPPEAKFTFSQGEGPNDEWKDYTFSNQSLSAITYTWTFGDGNASSTEVEPKYTYPGEGTYTVTLTATDKLGVTNTFSQDIEVKQPPAPAVTDPVLINADFNKVAKSSGSPCTCSGWINKSLGDQGESSSGNGGSDNVVKYDDKEPDHTYQEFEVQPNADYTIKIVVSFKSLTSGTSTPSEFELRVLAGSGYVGGYTPTYYTKPEDFPQDNFGYTSITQVEDTNNNLLTKVIANPSDTSYITYQYNFNSGANNSVALFMRGIGGDASGKFGYNSGTEEIRVDSVIVEAL